MTASNLALFPASYIQLPCQSHFFFIGGGGLSTFKLGVQDYEKYLKVKLIICSGHIWYGQKKRNHSS